MSDIEVLLTDIGEVTARELTKKYKPYGLNENKKIAKEGGKIAMNTRKDIESKLGESVVTNDNALPYQYYADDNKKIETK